MGISNSKDGDDLNDVIPSKGHRGGPDINPNKAKRYNGDVPMSGAPLENPSANMSGEMLSSTEINSENMDMNDIVPTVFRWEHGGRTAYITGTFNNWERQIPMHRSGNDFSYVHNLERGKHAFKFVIDDEWRFAPDLPTVADVEGRINNFIDVTTFAPYTGDNNFFEKSKDSKVLNEEFRQVIPDLDEYTKEPPTLPPHLRHIILNKSSPTTDPLALPSPQTVSLNHLYCTAIKDGMMVLGATHRYKEKYFTIAFYSIMPISTSQIYG